MTKRISMTTTEQLSQQFPFKKTMLALCVGAAMQPTAWAQTEGGASVEDEALEEVTVYGVRSSLKTAQDLKRNADTHVDAISASDIGSLPDVSVLEALQRVPGVSIERFQAANDTDHFTSEGASVSLRGLPYTRSEFNGRDAFSADSNRGLSFADVPPELLNSVEIYKNHTADQIEGGISGTINLNTRKPFDSEGQKIAFEVNGNYGSLEEEFTGGFSGLYSNRWEVEGGEIGFLVSYADSELAFRTDGVEFGRQYFSDSAQAFVPVNAGIRSLSTDRQRSGGTLVLQYENTDKTFAATAEYVRSDSTIEWVERAFFGDDAGSNGSGFGADAQFAGGTLVGGTLTGLGGGFGPQTRRQDTNSLVEDFALNLSFQVNDRLNVSADFQYVDSTRDQEDLSVFGALANNGNVRAQILSAGDTPQIRFLAPAGSGQSDAEFFSDPSNYFYRAAMEHLDDAEGNSTALKLDAEYDLEMDFFKSVEVGVRYAERDQTDRWANYNWGNVSESWCGGRADFNGSTGCNGYGVSGASAFTFDGFFGGDVNALPGNVALFGSEGVVSSYDAFLAAFPTRNNPALASRGGVVEGTAFLPAEINEVTEENTAAYVRVNFGNDESPFSGNFGLRYVNVDFSVAGGLVFPTPFSPDVAALLPADLVAFANNFSDPSNADSSFSEVLPSLNVRYEIDDEQLIRFGLARAISLPNLGSLRYNYSIGGAGIDTVQDGDGNLISATQTSPFTQTSGNPFLKPVSSINLDLSYEYYFADDGYVSAGIFYKDLSDFISTQSVDQLVTNPSNGIAQTVSINQPINISDASLTGFEFAYQQFFDNLPGIWSGLGMQFNYTYLNPSDVPQQSLSTQQPRTIDNLISTVTEGLPLAGLSENQFNIVGIYQNDKLEARLAYNWRDEYLLTPRNVINALPAFQEARGQLDGSVFYNITDALQIGVQATNILEEETRVENQITNDGLRVFRTAFASDTRYTVMLRGNF